MIRTGSLFTPRLANGRRMEMALNAQDIAKVQRGHSWQADVTDQLTGKSYRVRGADCGCPGCMCDAVVVKELVA